jgi:hypothetical protein
VKIEGRTIIWEILTSAILLYHRSIDSAGSTVGIDSTSGEQFLSWNPGKEIYVMLVETLQLSLIIDIHMRFKHDHQSSIGG